ncbi:BLUF domain-containing protein [Methylobacterium segetis]|uniref:BLUF domain-containing protein n=1 Tax=Methylobacterium segetis TaxID=2488750 RepID=UPI001045750A|nr:BLUF domain-containing protein [Methylobacterium segetis]
MSDLYRLVYASKNLLPGSDADAAASVAQILATSQRNNPAAGVTGALMFNAGAFAQVLEGPRRGVEDTFERIQRDMRHGDVTVLQCGPVESRGFANWSMAFVGHSAQGRSRWSGLAAESGFDLSRLDGDAVFAMLHGLVLEEEGLAAAPAPAREEPDLGPAPAALDVTRVRAEIGEIWSDLGTAQETGQQTGQAPRAGAQRDAVARRQPRGASEAALIILKAALASERERTSALRNELDDAQVDLATARDQLAVLREERDRWVERARLLAAALCEEAVAIGAARGDEAGAVSQPGQAPGKAGSARNAA